MKTKNKLVLITILLTSFQTMFAQELHSTGAIPYMKVEKIHTIVNTLDNPATIAYAHNSQGGATLSMPIPAGTPWTTLGSFTAPQFASSMVKGGNGIYYLTDVTPILFQFNPASGSVTQLGAITGTAGDQIQGISFNPEDGNYYLVSSTNFYSLNISTYAAQLIGSMSIAGSFFIDLAFDAAGVCYAYDITTDAAYTINPATGAATILGPLGYDANFGQGMSYDFETQTIYLSAFNNGTFTAQLRTMNPSTGWTTLLTDWGLEQLAPFALDTQYGPPCPVGAPSNPNPPNGATGIPLTGNSATWTNGAGTVNVELWFGPALNIVKVYDGPAISSYALPTLNYNTLYRWYVVCKDSNCGTQGPTWSFTTVPSPLLDWCDQFNNLNNWTIVGPLGLTNWTAAASSSAGGTAPELRMSWTPSFNGESKIRSVVIPFQNNITVYYSFNFYFDWYADPSGTVTVGITYDGGATSLTIYSIVDPTGNVGPTVISGQFYTPSSGSQNAQIEITFSGNSFNNDNIYWDNLCLWPGFPVYYPPNAPSNLTAQVIFDPGPKVQLGWQDNSWNESGFRVNRKNGQPNDPGDYVIVGTVGQNQTQYIDATVAPESTYTYRVFAYNQYGQNGSNTATIAVPVPVELISFTAEVDENVVSLFWQTATEMNNQGFEIERAPSKSPPKGETSGWQRIGFVEGKGTTTEIQSYSFTDKPEPGMYKYRLKQIDYDGTFAYSPEVEAEVQAPNVFSLEQNYPNPFNPTTKIKYTIPSVETRHASSLQMVTLIIYDILGNEVATLVNEEQAPGVYEVEFNTLSSFRLIRNLTSGIYFYQLKAGSFIVTKKMILLK